MKLTNLFFLVTLLALAAALPWKDQIALLNSLEVGRDEEPMTWSCYGCEEINKPLTSSIIQEKAKDVKAILSVYPEYTVLAFRYTATITNFFQDLLWAFQVDFISIQVQDEHAPAGCKVQREFDRMWNSIRDDVLAGLRTHRHTGRLIITGISLGGGLSCLSYVDIAKSGIFEKVEVITFGAPRVGNKNWANWFDTQTSSLRFYISGDPIAALPRCLTPICNYKQTGTAIVCHKNSETCVEKNPGEIEELSPKETINAVTQAVTEHYLEEDGDDNGLIDHITGYKLIRTYTLVD